ncbi:hypothetical protein ACF06X_14055 [Streptomyces sp. NPDC015346]|uniref:hypothetical protein n=1 Tax=Streptomyces sp. NPDC015346 TaxID=3364954 RepID=UPI0036FEF4E7
MLGRRWVYDGTHDPVLVARLLALVEGRAEPQAQSESDTPDPTVTRHFRGPGGLSAPKTAEDGPEGTDLLVEATGGGSDSAASRLTLTVTRVLRAEDSEADGVTAGTLGGVTAGWRTPEGHERRGSFVVLREPAR